jgi:hypothetical protein
MIRLIKYTEFKRSCEMKKKFMILTLISGMIFTAGMGVSYADAPEAKDMPVEKQSEDSGLTGKVEETMDSGGYTYISIKKDGKQTWVAIPKTEIKVGEEVTFRPGSQMHKFRSKTLGRTFETIIFSPGTVGGAEEEAKTSGEMPSDSTHGAVAAGKKVEKIKVEKASGPNAYTVAELYAKSGDLNTKKVVLRGQVVKVTQAIMGKNWIHMQDGSGSSSDGTDDIIVTSQDIPMVGDIVTAEGTLYKDKDFGSGYKYSVILEEASIKK